ncbi:MAG: type II toxin-antitoxin system RatA family toxin [Candidatus Thioglobus sp.]|nr:type II toxin-antitoxin system RatA family toxin [Candidatus Thioglobus sp.]
MHNISKNAIVPYSAQQMYNLVNKIDDYPKFLNWCNSATILNQTDEQITASIKISKGTFEQIFTTTNRLTPNQRIDIKLKDGIFKELNGAWIFTKLNENACKIELELSFSFASKLMDIAVSPVFTAIANSQLENFIARAKQLY